jgi:uncharacterized protein YukE
MAQGFYGADPEQLRTLAKQFSSGSNQIRSSLETVSSLVNSGQNWRGPDASAFVQRWNGSVKSLGNTVVQALEVEATALIKNADEQTAASSVGGSGGGPGGHGGPGGSGPGGSGPGGPGAPEATNDPGNPFMDGWGRYGQIKTLIDVPRDAYGLSWLLSHGKSVFSEAEWARIAGRSAPFNLLDSAHDIANLDNLYKYIPALNISDDVLNSSTGLMRVKNGVFDFVGQGGLGKGLGVLGVGLDAYDTASKIAEGDMGGAAWSATKTALGVASFLPPPAGTIAGAVSLGIAVYELPGVKEFVDNGAKAVADTVSNAVKDPGKFAKDVGNNLKDAGEGVKNFLGL